MYEYEDICDLAYTIKTAADYQASNNIAIASGVGLGAAGAYAANEAAKAYAKSNGLATGVNRVRNALPYASRIGSRVIQMLPHVEPVLREYPDIATGGRFVVNAIDSGLASAAKHLGGDQRLANNLGTTAALAGAAGAGLLGYGLYNKYKDNNPDFLPLD